MDKGYYQKRVFNGSVRNETSQSTIKMDKGYYGDVAKTNTYIGVVAIHNKNGQGLLLYT